jgi:acetyl esterase/lipase
MPLLHSPFALAGAIPNLLAALTLVAPTVWINVASPSVARAADATDIPAAVPLWPKDDPCVRTGAGEPNVRTTDNGEHVVSNIHAPSLTPYLPDPAQATGCAVIIAPGGGHRELCVDHEGHNLARWLQGRGIAAFVLLYRLAKEEGSTYTVDDHALADMQQAVRVVRARADEWNVDPHRVGVLGFSAGGELAALVSMHNDPGNPAAGSIFAIQSCRPDFQALIYPGRSARYTVAKDSPPVFIACGFQDREDIAQGMAEVYLKYKEAGVPAELHIYAAAGHGFGVRENTPGAVGHWPERFEAWLADMKMLKNSAQ